MRSITKLLERSKIGLVPCRASRAREAWDMLTQVYDRFTEGYDSADLKVAAQLLNE